MSLTRNFPSATILMPARPILILNETQASGVGGGTFTQSVWQTRVLNTVQYNGISGASLNGSNQFILPTGTYCINVSAPAFNVNNHQSKLYNITNSTDILFGSSEQSVGNTNRSFIVGIFTITSAKTFEIRHYCATTSASTGFGVPTYQTSEIYTQIKIEQLSPVSVTATGITNNIDFLTCQVFGN